MNYEWSAYVYTVCFVLVCAFRCGVQFPGWPRIQKKTHLVGQFLVVLMGLWWLQSKVIYICVLMLEHLRVCLCNCIDALQFSWNVHIRFWEQESLILCEELLFKETFLLQFLSFYFLNSNCKRHHRLQPFHAGVCADNLELNSSFPGQTYHQSAMPQWHFIHHRCPKTQWQVRDDWNSCCHVTTAIVVNYVKW